MLSWKNARNDLIYYTENHKVQKKNKLQYLVFGINFAIIYCVLLIMKSRKIGGFPQEL